MPKREFLEDSLEIKDNLSQKQGSLSRSEVSRHISNNAQAQTPHAPMANV